MDFVMEKLGDIFYWWSSLGFAAGYIVAYVISLLYLISTLKSCNSRRDYYIRNLNIVSRYCTLYNEHVMSVNNYGEWANALKQQGFTQEQINKRYNALKFEIEEKQEKFTEIIREQERFTKIISERDRFNCI